ncbi:conserved protein of unknown function [Rhodovastum atsumiense]|uniref:Uncharacterized protein n=1 Tax=Rhodovastum atsumiense TaxID=504468 RepID=A0A5M6ISK2_9PROT|nr:hypothetical protein [Rhodovastum atsumiense]KAA5611293.1 hypothetical protein F1189_15180 [Rhodovastum atsumiense]CAH2601759.1 conserved protein of unknown function [Rhodovastum atsumiense]
MSPGTIVALEFAITFGVPIWLCLRPMGATRDDPDRRGPPPPAPVTPPAPEPVLAAPRALPDCLLPRPQARLQEAAREKEPA